MRKFLFLICVVMALPSIANDDIKLWSEGPLTWSDFQQLLPATSSESSRLEVELSATPQESGATTRLEARAMMHRNASCTSAAQSTPERLRYHQLQFDLLELMRRHLQEEINSGIDGGQVEKRLRYYQDQYRQRARQIAQETKHGALEAAVSSWEDNIASQLAAMGTPRVPQVTTMQGCYGVVGGVGYDLPTGKLHDNFGGSVMFHLGLTGGYKRLRLKGEVAFGQPSFRNDNIFDVAPDEQGRPLQGNNASHPTHIMASLQLGFTVLNHGRLSITPNVGSVYNRYNWEVDNYRWDKDDEGRDVRLTTSVENRNLHNVNFIASIDFDINLSSRVTNTSLTGLTHRERWTSSLRITPWVAASRFTKCVPEVSGVHVGINISYLGLARLFRL